jgi:hypothetical protein
MKTDPTLYLPSSVLRRSYEHARGIAHEEQIRELADLLSNPEIIAGEVIDAYANIESFDESELSQMCHAPQKDPNEDSGELMLDHFFEGQEIEVLSDPGFGFRCIAVDVLPVPELFASPDGMKDGLNYICEHKGDVQTPVLGVVQSSDDTAAYPLLMRALACFTEIASPSRYAHINESILKSSLPAEPCFDLQLVLWEEDALSDTETTICQLTHDLAEVVLAAISGHASMAARLSGIRCLKMDPRRFDNRLTELWHCEML